MDEFQIITAVVAILGLFLSIYALWRQKRDKKPSVKVTTSYSVVGSPGIGITSPQLFSTTAMNTGQVVVHLSHCGILIPNGRKLQFVGADEYTEKSLPVTLYPGKSITISRALDGIINDLQREGYSGTVSGYCYFMDEIDNTYKGKKIKFQIP